MEEIFQAFELLAFHLVGSNASLAAIFCDAESGGEGAPVRWASPKKAEFLICRLSIVVAL